MERKGGRPQQAAGGLLSFPTNPTGFACLPVCHSGRTTRRQGIKMPSISTTSVRLATLACALFANAYAMANPFPCAQDCTYIFFLTLFESAHVPFITLSCTSHVSHLIACVMQSRWRLPRVALWPCQRHAVGRLLRWFGHVCIHGGPVAVQLPTGRDLGHLGPSACD